MISATKKKKQNTTGIWQVAVACMLRCYMEAGFHIIEVFTSGHTFVHMAATAHSYQAYELYRIMYLL